MSEYKDHQYIKNYESRYLNEQEDANGNVIHANATKVIHYDLNLANTQGMRKMKTKKLFEIHDEIIKSNVDARLFSFIVNNQSLTSRINVSIHKPVTTKYLSEKFNVSERKVQKFISAAIELDMLKRVNKNLFLNPYLSSPFKATNNQLHQLQIWWDSEPEEEIEFVNPKDATKQVIENLNKIKKNIKDS